MDSGLYKSVLEKSSLGFAYHKLVFDENNQPCDYIFLEVNKAFETLTGLKAVDIIGKRITKILPNIRNSDFDWIAFYGDITQNNLHKEFKQFSQPLKKDYWVNAFSPEKNHFVTLFSFPQKNTADFKKLFENMPIGGVIYKVINDGMLGTDYIGLDFNNQSCLLESKTREEMIGKTSYDLRPSLDSYGLIDVFREVWETGVSQKFPTKMYIDEKFSNYYDIDVFRLSEDEIVAMVKDVTETMQNQEELKEKTHKLATYIDKAPYGIFIADQNGYYLEANEEACKITEYSNEELIGKNLLDLTVKEHRKIAKESFGELKKSGFTEANLKFLTKNGQIRWWNTRAVKLNENSYLGFAVDITDKKLLEEKNINMQMMLQNQQKLEAIGTLASGVAHEINNPINGIMNYSQLIADATEDGSEAKIYANEIIAETKRITEIVQSLLQFSRQEKTTYSLADIQDIVNSTLTLVNSIIKHDSITFTVNIEEDLPQIRCRSQQIQQVILNLITNSRYSLNEKYGTDYNRKKLDLSVKLITGEKKEYIQLSIKDNGNGIPTKIKDQIFDPFFTTKPREKGTGLGLSISYGIIKEHKGDLYFKSKKGQFTTFYVDLPVADNI